MINYIWSILIIIGIIVGCLSNKITEVSNCILDSSKEAVELCIFMLGVVGVWSGIMNVAVSLGIVEQIKKLLQPVLRFLFPKVRDEKTKDYISMNLVANMLGLGWAATPSGLKAMKCLQEVNKTSIASDEMCTLLVVNISSLQLIPINIIAYRSQYGSGNPTAVILPGLIATCVSTLVGVLFCKCMQKRKGKRR